MLALRVQPTMRQGARAGKAGRGERPVCGASGFCSACWVWCARVQGVGPCSRFELRSTRYVQSQSVTGVQPGPIEHRRARSRHPARVCGQRMGTLWGSRARAHRREPASLARGWILPGLGGGAPGCPRQTLRISPRHLQMHGCRRRVHRRSGWWRAQLEKDDASGRLAPLFFRLHGPSSPKRENRFSWAPLFFTKFHKNAFFKRSACSVTLCEYNRTRIIHTIHVKTPLPNKNLFKELVVIPFRRSM